MKRYIHASSPTLFDICDKVDGIIFVQNALTFNFEDVFGADEQTTPNNSQYTLSKNDVSEILKSFASCSSIVLANHRKRLISENLGVGPIVKEDLVNIVKHLTLEDYTKCILNSNPDHVNCRLIEFITNKSFKLLNGNTLSGVKVYIKINLDESDGDVLLAVSFHSTNNYGKHPYTDSLD